MNATKQSTEYLDLSINLNAQEKSCGFSDFLGAPQGDIVGGVSMLEVGPGGGAAIHGLADFLQNNSAVASNLDLTVLEQFKSTSVELEAAQKRCIALGSTVQNIMGDITCMPFPNDSFNFSNISAVLHEVFSYDGGYQGVELAIRELARVTVPGGVFSYRDIHASTDDIHRIVEQEYVAPSWVEFLQTFLPYYLKHANHPYDLRQVDIKYNETVSGYMPEGLARDIQRHYITFRDHIWRSGVLGIRPTAYSYEATDWLKEDLPEKKVYFEVVSQDDLSLRERLVLGEDEHGTYAAGSVFDEVTDQLMTKLLNAQVAEMHIRDLVRIWHAREGAEVYIYDTPETLVNRVERAGKLNGHTFVVEPESSRKILRQYYTRYLKTTLGQFALEDAKLLVTFRKQKEK